MTPLRAVLPEGRQGALGPPFHEWTLPDGSLWATLHRSGEGYVVRFPGLGDFEIDADGRGAVCRPCPRLTDATRQHLFLNQVRPLMLARQGVPVFHGSAVEGARGAIAFLGASGRGKSTLAAAFAVAGARHLSDDAVVLRRQGDVFVLHPGAPAIRLWDDSQTALFPEGVATAAPVSYTSKARITAGAAIPHSDAVLPLAAAFFLGDGTAGDIVLDRLTGAGAAAAWIAHGFVLDPGDPDFLDRQFGEVALLAAAVPCYRLDYPRRYGMLDRVRAAVLADT